MTLDTIFIILLCLAMVIATIFLYLLICINRNTNKEDCPQRRKIRPDVS